MQGIKKDIDLANRIRAIHAHTDPPKAFQELTDAPLISWDVSNGLSAYVILTGSVTRGLLAPTNVEDGDFGTLKIEQGMGNDTLTLPGSFNVVNGGAGAVTLTAAIGSIDIISWVYTDSKFWTTIGLNFTP